MLQAQAESEDVIMSDEEDEPAAKRAKGRKPTAVKQVTHPYLNGQNPSLCKVPCLLVAAEIWCLCREAQ